MRAERRSRRPPFARPDAWLPAGLDLERELQPDGQICHSLTAFLTGAECPFSCVFCDLYRYTLDRATPRTALVSQIELVLAHPLARELDLSQAVLKLYNAANFFEERAVPTADDAALLRRARRFRSVVVECHARLLLGQRGGDRAKRWIDALSGGFELALGLETVHEGALERLDKDLSLDEWEQCVSWLLDRGARLRTFLLVGTPFIASADQAEWVARGVRFALERGCAVVSLIPVRPGNGELEWLEKQGEFVAPELSLVEECCEAAAEALRSVRQARNEPARPQQGRSSVSQPKAEGSSGRGPLVGLTLQVDPWDLERLCSNDEERHRCQRLRQRNLEGWS